MPRGTATPRTEKKKKPKQQHEKMVPLDVEKWEVSGSMCVFFCLKMSWPCLIFVWHPFRRRDGVGCLVCWDFFREKVNVRFFCKCSEFHMGELHVAW